MYVCICIVCIVCVFVDVLHVHLLSSYCFSLCICERKSGSLLNYFLFLPNLPVLISRLKYLIDFPIIINSCAHFFKQHFLPLTSSFFYSRRIATTLLSTDSRQIATKLERFIKKIATLKRWPKIDAATRVTVKNTEEILGLNFLVLERRGRGSGVLGSVIRSQGFFSVILIANSRLMPRFCQ